LDRGNMSLTYVIPDTHGRRDLLDDALAEIDARSRGTADTIITIGDYVDKGPQSKQVIDRLLSGVGCSFVALKGNHDAMMVEGLRDATKTDSWLANGGDAALASYGGDAAAVPRAHIAWLDQLRLLHVDAHRIYVHAGLDPKGFPDGFGRFHVVHGHDNCPEGPLLYGGRTNLDTLAWRTGRLTVGVFDDATPGGPVDFIVIKGAPAGR
jgi:serine/threonine protein phosphatase 1